MFRSNRSSSRGRAASVVQEDSSPRPGQGVTITSHPTMRALLAICLFTYVAQNMLNVSIAPLARALAMPEWVVGLAVSMAAVFVTLLSQFWGRRSIAWGRRRVLLCALVLALIAGVLFAIAVWMRTAGLLAAGVAGAAIVLARGPFFGSAVSAIPPTGQALIAEITPQVDARVRGMAAFSGSIQLSIVIGSVVSGALGAVSIVAPVYATPVFVLIALIIGWFGIPDDGLSQAGLSRHFRRRSSISAITASSSTPLGRHAGATPALPPRVSWADRRLSPWIASAVGMFFASGVVQIIAGFIVQDRLGLSPQRAVSVTGLMLLANAAGAMLTQLWAVPHLGWAPSRLLRVGVTLALLSLTVLAVANVLWLMSAATFVVGVASGLVGPGFSAGGSLAVSQAEQGGVAGVLNATGSLTWIFAPVTATALYGWHPTLPFALAGIFLFLSTLIAWLFLPSSRRI